MTAVSVRPLPGAAASPRSRRDRSATDLRGFAIRDDGSTVDVTLTDLSYDGCGIDCPVALRAGEQLGLTVHRHAMIAATVRWAQGARPG